MMMMMMIFTMSCSVGLSTSWRMRTLTAVVERGMTLLSTGGGTPFRQHKRFSLFLRTEFLVLSPRVPFDLFLGRRRRPYIVFRNRFLYGFMFVYIYIYIYKYIYVYICQDGGAVGFVDFTKLLFDLSSLAQPLK